MYKKSYNMLQLKRRDLSNEGGKMNKFLKNNISKILSIFILLQPVLDLITGLCVNLFNINLTLGIIIRILFLALIMYITIFVYKKKISLWVYISIIFYSVLYLIGIILYNDGLLFQEIQGLVRVFYFPMLLISLYEIKDDIKISNMTLITTLMMYLIFIFVPILLNVGFKSYQITKSGTLGFYNSANEISGIISLLTPIMFVILKGKNKLLLKSLVILIYLVVILTVGTKTPLLSLCITIGATFCYYMLVCLKKKTYKPIIYAASLIIVGLASLILILPKTNFYKNIKVHLDYLEVTNITEIFTEYELVDHFIFSQRLTFLKNKNKLYENSTIYEKLFGIGYVKNNKITKMIEMDYFDIFYSHGIVGFILFFGIYIYVLYNILKDKQVLTYERSMKLVSLILIILLTLFTGHIITAPSVSLIVVALILSLSKRKKKDLLFTAVNFEIGGIETALLNLLNNIDYKKYNVDVILEEKKGTMIPRLNKNANVTELKVSNHSNVFIRKIINLSRKLIFSIFNYHNYDFSCSFATYSFSGNKLALAASENNSLYVHSDYKYIYKNKEEMYQFFNQRNVDKLRRIFFVSNQSKKSFVELYKELESKCYVYNNFIDTDMIIEKSKVKIDIEKPKNKTVLVFVGRLDDHSKKLSRAINLVKEISNLQLWIIGDGPDRKMYEDLVKSNNLSSDVTFFGKKENPYPYMLKGDYIILTSDYEGFPVTYLEAITLNKPIITTIDVSDDKIDIGKDYAYIVSKQQEQMIKEVEKAINEKPKIKKVNFKDLQKDRMKNLEAIFNEVI